MYSEKFRIKLFQTDAAGILFYARLFEICQSLLENFFHELGFELDKILYKKTYITPIVHAESDYLMPMKVGDEIVGKIFVEKIGVSSFTTCFNFYTDDKLCARARNVNVSVDKSTGEKIKLPDELIEFLKIGAEKLLSKRCQNKEKIV